LCGGAGFVGALNFADKDAAAKDVSLSLATNNIDENRQCVY